MKDIREHCCGADTVFDQKRARKQYNKYLKKGPEKVTQVIIDQLKENLGDIDNLKLLDVGGGIGAIQWWFLESGGKKTISIDASTSYLKLSEQHAKDSHLEDQTDFIMGDFVEDEKFNDKVDVVTMDKVICCYPDYKTIINKSCDQSKMLITVSYPVDGILSSFVVFLGSIFIKFKTRTFQPYVHSVKEIRDQFTANGFKRSTYKLSFPWHVETYRNTNTEN